MSIVQNNIQIANEIVCYEIAHDVSSLHVRRTFTKGKTGK